MSEKLETIINIRVPSEMLARIDAAVNARPLRISRHAWIMEAIYMQLQNETTEGTLTIFWENNHHHAATPRYRLLFSPYSQAFRSGAMQPISIVGDAGLQAYLVELKFTAAEAVNWM